MNKDSLLDLAARLEDSPGALRNFLNTLSYEVLRLNHNLTVAEADFLFLARSYPQQHRQSPVYVAARIRNFVVCPAIAEQRTDYDQLAEKEG